MPTKKPAKFGDSCGFFYFRSLNNENHTMMDEFSKIIPNALAEVRQMDHVNLLIILGMVLVWKLADIIRAIRGK